MGKIIRIIQRVSLRHLILLSLLLNLSMYFTIRPWNKEVENKVIVTSDAVGYETLAENILHYRTFAGTYDTASIPANSNQLQPGYLILTYDTFREPGYPAFLALVYFMVGIKPFVAIFLQLFLNVISVVLIYKITKLLFENSVVATLAGLIFAFDIHSIYMANVLYTDTLFVFLFLVSVYYFLSGLLSKKLFKFILSAIFLGLATLTRPVSLFYPLVLAFVLVLYYRKSIGMIVKVLPLYFVIVNSLAGTWALRNHLTYGRWQLTTEGNYGLLMFYEAFGESRNSNLPIDSVRTLLQAECDSVGCNKMRNPFDRSKICGQIAWKHIRQNKMTFAKTQVWGITHMFMSLGNIDMAQTLGMASSDVDGQLVMDSQRLKQNFAHPGQAVLALLIIAMLLLQYVGAIIGFIFLMKNNKRFILVFSVLTLLYFSLITGAVGKYRYKLPMQFVICSVAGYGYYSLLKRKIEVQ